MPKCRYCQAPVMWATTPLGTSLPLNEQPDPAGTHTVEDGVARPATEEDRRQNSPLFSRHTPTCQRSPATPF
jgi:hypothetical protein